MSAVQSFYIMILIPIALVLLGAGLILCYWGLDEKLDILLRKLDEQAKRGKE